MSPNFCSSQPAKVIKELGEQQVRSNIRCHEPLENPTRVIQFVTFLYPIIGGHLSNLSKVVSIF